MSEEKRIMDLLGIGQIEGNVRGEHTGKLLTFLKTNSGKRWDYIMRVSPVVMGMQRRYIKENYLEGFVELGIIKLHSKDNILYYEWFGEKELNGQSLIPTEPEQVMNELKDMEKETEKEINKDNCPNCGKKLKKNKKICNEKCLREYYDKRKKEGKSVDYEQFWKDAKILNKEKKVNE